MRPILTFNSDRCLACLSCELACSLAHSASELLEAAAAEPGKTVNASLFERISAGWSAHAIEQAAQRDIHWQ